MVGRESGSSFPCCVGSVWFIVVVMCINKIVFKSIYMGIFLGLLKAKSPKSQRRLRSGALHCSGYLH